MSYGLNLGWGGIIGDYIRFWGGPIKGYTTNLVQGSYEVGGFSAAGRICWACTGCSWKRARVLWGAVYRGSCSEKKVCRGEWFRERLFCRGLGTPLPTERA